MKKQFIKLAAMSLAAVMSIGMLAGCGTTNDTNTDDKLLSETPEATDGVLIMGTNAAFPPFEFTTTDGLLGEFDGIDVAIALEIAKSVNKELQIEDMEFDGLLGAVQTGKVDMVVAGMTADDERRKSVDFSDTYYTASQVMVVAADNEDINSAEDLKNDKKVGVVIGYTGDTIVTETLAIDEANITRANRGIDIVQDVKNGKLDAVVIDSATGKALAEKTGLKVVEDSEVFDTEEYAIAVAKGNTELLESINKVLAELKENGTIAELAEKYN